MNKTVKKSDKVTLRVPLLQAAKELGLAPQGLREYMKRGLIDIGAVVPAAGGEKRLRYLIYRDKLDRYLGKAGEDQNREKG